MYLFYYNFKLGKLRKTPCIFKNQFVAGADILLQARIFHIEVDPKVILAHVIDGSKKSHNNGSRVTGKYVFFTDCMQTRASLYYS